MRRAGAHRLLNLAGTRNGLAWRGPQWACSRGVRVGWWGLFKWFLGDGPRHTRRRKPRGATRTAVGTLIWAGQNEAISCSGLSVSLTASFCRFPKRPSSVSAGPTTQSMKSSPDGQRAWTGHQPPGPSLWRLPSSGIRTESWETAVGLLSPRMRPLGQQRRLIFFSAVNAPNRTGFRLPPRPSVQPSHHAGGPPAGPPTA